MTKSAAELLRTDLLHMSTKGFNTHKDYPLGSFVLVHKNKTKRRTKQYHTKQSKTKQNKTKQSKIKQSKTKQNKTKQNKTRPTRIFIPSTKHINLVILVFIKFKFEFFQFNFM